MIAGKMIRSLALAAAFLSTTSIAAALELTTPPTDENLVIVHYHRFDGDYTRPGLWAWDMRNEKTPDEPELDPAGRTDYGIFFVIDRTLYGSDDSDAERIGFIPRLNRDWNRKDGGDRSWTPDLGREIWLVANDPIIYTERPNTDPQVVTASIDSLTKLAFKFSHPMTAGEIAALNVTIKSGEDTASIQAVRGVMFDNAKTYFVEVDLAEPIDFPAQEWVAAFDGFEEKPLQPRGILKDPELFFTDKEMGAVYTPEKTTFRLFSPLASEAHTVLYETATARDPLSVNTMEPVGQGVWEVEVPGDLEGTHYRFRVTTDKYRTVELNDPYATNTTGDDGHARITNIRALDPEGFRPIARPRLGNNPTDAIIYEIHIGDLTWDPNSGVSEDKRGRYLGFIERNTTHDGHPTGLDHIVALGVTHLQILPPQDFDNDEDKPEFNWGYMTDFFNAPEGTYSSDFRTTARISEFKQMIHGVKESGLGVIMDVVYNHTGTQNTFERLSPNYYLRMRPDGSFWNGSGTGNEFRSEAPMARRFILESMRYWMEEFGIDGYRFDLMALIDRETLLAVRDEMREVFPEVLIYGEPWAATGPDGSGLKELVYKDKIAGTGIGAFNDHFRDAIKGSPGGDDPAYIQNGSRKDGVMRGIMGSIDDWTRSPGESINYAEAHDDYTIWDKLAISAPNATEEEKKSMVMLAGGILAVSQGVMFLHAGQEFARTKNGVKNSYNAGYEINKMDWARRAEFADMVDYHAGVIAVRRAHPVFRLATAQEIRERLRWTETPSPNSIAFVLDGSGIEGETWERVAVFINPDKTEQEFTIPFDGPANAYIHGTRAGTEPLSTHSGTITVPPISLALVAQEKDS